MGRLVVWVAAWVWLAAAAAFAGPTDGGVDVDVVGYWPLAGDDYDVTAFERHGRRQGGVSDGVLTGPFTGSASFKGGWIAVPPTGSDPRGFTVSGWMHFDRAGSGFAPILGRLGVTGASNGLAYDCGDGCLIDSGVQPQWRRWAHVALVHDAPAAQVSLWINGWKTGDLKVPPGHDLPMPFTGGFGIGGKDGAKPSYVGQVADVMVHARPLVEAEIHTLAQGLGRRTPQQVAIAEGCGSGGQAPCQVCRRYVAWPASRWGECEPGRLPWCAGYSNANPQGTCP